jgi:hypothetical protein
MTYLFMFLRCEEYSGKENLEVMWLLIVLNIQFFLIKKKKIHFFLLLSVLIYI